MTYKDLSNLANELCGNYYVSLDNHPELIETVLSHESFAYAVQKSAHSISIYYYCDDSPTRVKAFAAIDVSKEQMLKSRICGIQEGLNWCTEQNRISKTA